MKELEEPRTFMQEYWGCSNEEIERWEEAMSKLPFANFDNVIDLMEKYAKKAHNFAIEKAAENAEIYHAQNEFEDTGYIDRQSILKLKL